MSSFLLEKKRLKTWEEKIQKKSQRTQDGYDTVIKAFDIFCRETYADRNKHDIFDELKTLRGKDYILAIIDILQRWIDWHYSHTNTTTGKSTKTSTVKLYLSWLGKYLSHNEIEITDKIRGELDFKLDESDERFAMETHHIQTIFSVAKPIKQGFYKACASTGARPGELLQVRKKDIDTSLKRIKITIHPEGVKTRAGRSLFLTKESGQSCLMRLRQIDDDDLVWGKNNNPLQAEKAESKTFSRYCDQVGFTKRYHSNNYRKITLYSFRSFFFSACADVHREGYAHKMTGHGGYLPQYDRMSDSKKLEWFLKVEPFLTIDETLRKQQEYDEIKKRNTELEKTHIAKDEVKEIISNTVKEEVKRMLLRNS